LSAVLLPALAGCRQDDIIQQETVTHEEREPIRLRVAMLFHGDSVWFIRLDGPESQVKEQQATFDAFVKSTRFTDKKDEPISWTEPKEWKKDPPRDDRYASFRITAKPKELEVKVSPLSAKDFDLMKNMHRWQKHVNKPLSERPEDNEQYTTREKFGKLDITWVDMTGLGVHTVSKAPDPLAANKKDFLLANPMNEAGRIPFKYAVPEGWAKKPARKLALDVYEVAEGNRSAEVTLTPLGGDPASNINRWRDQVGLKEAPPDAIAKSTKLIMVAGINSYYVDIANPQYDPAKNRILGVIVPFNRKTSWFIKMTGPVDVVGQQKNAFETFVQSFKKDAR
jgi:hypothetical protein